jgi:hypothetical protein
VGARSGAAAVTEQRLGALGERERAVVVVRRAGGGRRVGEHRRGLIRRLAGRALGGRHQQARGRLDAAAP